MSPDTSLDLLVKNEGIIIEWLPTSVVAKNVPCVLSTGQTGVCDLGKSHHEGGSLQPTTEEGGIHAVHVHTRGIGDGWIYEANGEPLANQLGDYKIAGWKTMSLARDDGNEGTADEIIARYARQSIGAARAKQNSTIEEGGSIARIAKEIMEQAAGVKEIQDKVRKCTVAVIGCGGTGSYIVDMLTKTSIREIVIVDGDKMRIKNTLRCPGGTTEDELKDLQEGRTTKTAYLSRMYGEGTVKLTELTEMASRTTASKLKEKQVEFAFICIEQKTHGDRPRQDEVYEGLQEVGIPFVDSGISLGIQEGKLVGSVTTSYTPEGGNAWRSSVPNARLKGGGNVYRNTQLAEVNALAAAMAIGEWRRRTGQYGDERSKEETMAKFRLEDGLVTTDGAKR